jgi:hypothetical protein
MRYKLSQSRSKVAKINGFYRYDVQGPYRQYAR